MPLGLQDQGSSSPRSGYALGVVLWLGGTLAGLAIAGLGSSALLDHAPPEARHDATAPVSTPPSAIGPEDVSAMVDRYCVRCHSERRRVADLVLESADPSSPGANPEMWEKVIDKLRLRSMPPPPNTRPDAETYDVVVEWLENELDQAWRQNPNPGHISPVHRLNRTEYNNAINDLLGIDVDVRDQLPGDETTDGGFDNVASALTISTVHLERYMSVARQVTRLATGLPPSASGVDIYRLDDLRDQTVRMSDDLPLGSRGGIAIPYNFPVSGEYVFSVKLTTNYAEYFRGMGWPQELDVRLDGELIERFVVGGGANDYRPVADHYAGDGSGPGWPGAPEWEEYMQAGAQEHLNVRVSVEAGPHVVGVSFPRYMWEDEYILPQQPLRLWGLAEKNSHDYMGFAGVSEVHIDGPHGVEGPASDTPSRQTIFTCVPESEAVEEACAEEILSRMARRAFRRPVQESDIGMLMHFFRLGREGGGSFDTGIQLALERLVVDPDFLLRVYVPDSRSTTAAAGSVEPPVRAVRSERQVTASYELSDIQLATRLAFFLWSSIPDEELLELAEEGRLSDEEVLRAQVQRMLHDPRSHQALVNGFASQWLTLRLVDELARDERIYPDFDHGMRRDMRRETELFVESTLREDRSVLDLLRADYTYVNARLARHYEIPNVVGSHFRRVQLPDLEKRGGLLGQASILAVSSYPDRTSPVLRGKWLIENILGSHVPPPPPDLDTSLQASEEETAEGREPSMRELLARHRESTACSSCHSVMDPLGFALESFDALGGWRIVDEKGHPVDDQGQWPSGEPVRAVSGLREMLLRNEEQFARTVTGKLMSYALGRMTEYYDQPAIRQIVRDAAEEDYRWSAIISGIVTSPQFRMSEAAESATQSR